MIILIVIIIVVVIIPVASPALKLKKRFLREKTSQSAQLMLLPYHT